MKHFFRIVSFVLSLVIAFCICPVTVHGEDTTTFTVDIEYGQTEARKTFNMVNQFRTGSDAWAYDSNGNRVDFTNLKEYTWDYTLEKVAMQRAAEAAFQFAHTRPDGTSCFTAYPSGYSSEGENIAWGWGMYDADRVVRLWREDNGKNSSEQGHRWNMLNKTFNLYACAFAKVNGFGVWVQEFGYKADTASAPINAVDTAAATSITFKNEYVKSITELDSENNTIVLNQGTASTSIAALNLKVSLTKPASVACGLMSFKVSAGNPVWKSADDSIAKVQDSKVISVKSGTTTISTSVYGTTITRKVIVGGDKMYRCYNPNSGEHFYTKNVSEKDHIVSLGWHDEGIGWYAPESSNAPVYRLYNAIGGEHHYTLNVDEKNHLVDVGWNYEGIGWYSDDAKTVPLYREYNPNAFSCNHNYTKDVKEHSHLVSLGWHDEGIAWYGIN